MTALNLQKIVCITGFIIAIHVYCDDVMHSSRIERHAGRLEYFISWGALDWQASINECINGGNHLANLMNNDEIEALKEVLKYHDLSEKKFWIYTCTNGLGGYCHGECTEISLQRDNRLAVIPLYGEECNRKKRYICEK